jgi:DNA polymerase-1
MPDNKTLCLIDGSSYVYRAFYALPALTTSKGFPTNAIYGFLNMLKKIIKESHPAYLAVAFDHKGPTFRHKAYQEYKITRKPTPEALKIQLPVLKDIISAYGIPIFEIPGYEADDVLAYLAIKGKLQGLNPVIVSSDKDILQMVKEGILVYNPQKDIYFNAQKVEEIYGIKPHQFADFLALTGDQTDNIPGVPGIGEKTARELITKFGSLEEILTNTDKLPPKVRRAIEDNKENLLLSRELARLKLDIDLKIEWEKLSLPKPDYKKLIPIFEKLEFRNYIKELLESVEGKIEIHTRNLSREEELSALIEKIKKGKILSFYFLKNENGDIFNAPGKLGDLYLYYDGICYVISTLLLEKKRGDIQSLLSSSQLEKVCHNGKEIVKLLWESGFEITGPIFDLELACYLLDPSWDDYSLYKLALNYHSLELASQILAAEQSGNKKYQAEVKVYTFGELYNSVKGKLHNEGMEELYYHIEEPLMFVLAKMESRGIKIDREYLSELLKDYDSQLEKLVSEIYSLAGEEFNINSPKQLRKILFDKLKLKPIKKGKTGASTDEETLRSLSREHDLPKLILKYRELSKIKTAYLQGLLNSIDPRDSKIHTSFNQTITQTGRLSCSNPNLQTIPIRSQLGKNIRRAFVPSEENMVFISADYSQIELRILAHLSREQKLIEAFRTGKDIHRHTASLIFGVPEDVVSNQMRDIAKTVNFGIIYGISSFGLSKQLNLPVEEASRFIKFYFQLYPGVKTYIEKTIVEAREKEFVKTLFNRIRYIPEINSPDPNLRSFGERLAINTPIQGSAADMIKKAMVELDREITKKRLNAHLLLQIHDELLLEADKENLDLIIKLIKDKMENVLTLAVPLVVNFKIGPNWLELKDVEI